MIDNRCGFKMHGFFIHFAGSGFSSASWFLVFICYMIDFCLFLENLSRKVIPSVVQCDDVLSPFPLFWSRIQKERGGGGWKGGVVIIRYKVPSFLLGVF